MAMEWISSSNENLWKLNKNNKKLHPDVSSTREELKKWVWLLLWLLDNWNSKPN